ncbi:uncharacterized protein [Henckelia pumila]|uniref:uncharacterized protein n=1 Tax=Henckelia pumila TaxID=405737 RepID=UPI003C6E2AD7
MSPNPLIGGETLGVSEDWIERLENCFRQYHCTEVQKMETLGFLLEGNARKWWRTISTPIIYARGVATWAEFRAALKNLYFPPALLQSKASKFLSLRQGSMTIDECRQKFIELLPFCSQFSVGGDQTYEDLVSRCHQEEDIIRRNRSMGSSSSVLNSSLGPRGQSFKKQGVTSSSSGSGGVHRFSGQKWSHCQQCGRRHPADIQEIPIVREFPDVFPEEIPGLPPVREIEFGIELVPGTSPISRAPFRLAPSEIRDFQEKLQDLLDNGYIRPSVLSWGAQSFFVDEHAFHLHTVLQILRERQLYNKLSKFYFLIDRVVYLGHLISRDGVSVDPIKTEAILNWMRPTTVSEIRSFL